MNNPLITLIVCSYNQEEFIRESLEGALSQTYSPMEIIFSDDCSSDNTFEIMKEYANAYNGKHSLVLNRNESNLGLIAHVNKVLAMAKGEIIIGSAGDDICLPHRAEVISKIYKERNGAPTLFHGDVLQIGPDGEDLGLLEATWGRGEINLEETAIRTSLYIGASSTFTKSLLNLYPEIQYKNAYEDLIWGFRAALKNAVVFVEEPLIKYRIGVGLSWNLHKAKEMSLESLTEIEVERLNFHLDMLKQRQIDLEHNGDKSLQLRLTPILQSEALQTKIKLDLINKQVTWIVLALRRPIVVLKALQWYRKTRKRIIRRAKRGY